MSQQKYSSKPRYSERVVPNLGTFAAVLVLLPSTTIIAEPFDFRVGVVIGLAGVLGLWSLLYFKAPYIVVTDSDLSVGKVCIPRQFIGKPAVIERDEIFRERGPNLDPAAYKVFQGTVKTALRIPLEDPEDPTPYWLVSTRKPQKLLEALTRI